MLEGSASVVSVHSPAWKAVGLYIEWHFQNVCCIYTSIQMIDNHKQTIMAKSPESVFPF